MSRDPHHRTWATLTVLTLFLFSFVPGASGYPILNDPAKKVRPAQQHNSSKPAVIATLGAYRDFTSVKRPVGGMARLRHAIGLRPISAKSVMVIDSGSGRTLFSRSPDTPRQPASTIKILTGMLAIDALKNGERVRVSRKAAKQPRSKIYLDTRRTYQAHDLINAVLIASANDASVALAEKIAGSEKTFADQMTALARRWGARNTVCKTASGLTAEGQKSTARDLAIMFRRAMLDREFAARMQKTKTRTAEGKLLRNHNKALWQIDGSVGGKTGYTNAARQTYVGKFKRGRHEIIVAIMGSESMWTDLKRLVEYGFARKQNVAAQPGPARPSRTATILSSTKKQKS
jgi:D-alanyl-D-alanine carboxypeptidase (penicillin-binding protein 5/6)